MDNPSGSDDTAKATIEKERPDVNVIVLPEGSSVTRDLRFDRVRVFVNQQNQVVQVPRVA
ncbi:Proteinase inhibitor I13, potato inhibitor I [Corchorus capsularis]|uniref:Proteinase inhibitor I13, potato inhibitor I n=1 Tax=Corchorus capsularis TaxID=210143 RepID=A0A1R3JQD5_COCAP|nr:Proteinase inhibitor I13, potato inhibitor I [Corchorus capsularis]